MAMWVSGLRSLRPTILILGVLNLLVVFLGGFLVFVVFPFCDNRKIRVPVGLLSFAAAFKIFALVQIGFAQKATAIAILNSSENKAAVTDSVVSLNKKMRYKIWLWWTRFATAITLLQIFGAIVLIYNVTKYISQDGRSDQCPFGTISKDNQSNERLVMFYAILVCCAPLVQCFAGSDVLRWRSFYATEDTAWKSHYQEMFDYRIREALCCLGRFEYLAAAKEDEVFSVARLLGDLVAYRASGTGHLELLAGLALLQRHREPSISDERLVPAPKEQIQEALKLHQFAEAAYTGPLLDFGRHIVFFPCAWFYRQGILTPWARERRPTLTGDNWWRGHAAAFLKHVDLPAESLRRGRVCQERCKAAYFIVVHHHLRTVVIAIRGTETPEDLITDGLGREYPLSSEDLDGLINSSHIQSHVKRCVESSFPHYGHSGIVEATRDLYTEIEGPVEDNVSEPSGFLSSLLGPGCECDGYNLRIVGHSLGGAIASLLGIRLYRKYPNLHVYAYGPLPCVTSTVAVVCSEFITSIIHNNEFSARLSVGSVLRLRAAAITALSQDSRADTALIFRLARQFICLSNNQKGSLQMRNPSELYSSSTTVEELNDQVHEGRNILDKNYSHYDESNARNSDHDFDDDNKESFHEKAIVHNPFEDPVSQFMEIVPTSDKKSSGNPIELFLPGVVIHMVPEKRNINMPFWRGWRFLERAQSYRASIANKASFADIVVSPSMFVDHLPWRCQNAMQKVLEAQEEDALLDESEMETIQDPQVTHSTASEIQEKEIWQLICTTDVTHVSKQVLSLQE